ncbi:hypothetical protein [Cytobacillus gottheilii]|uniref:hypothetical protein n=1 Tax=Cytobacillus gottheilii TaxID=859144 RepID=UPI0009B959A5|nr:hypothetical protein [Cytobacillus gottheilii]
MKLNAMGMEFTFENSEKGTSELIEKINELLANGDQYFSHLNIDGIEIYSEHSDYIVGNINDIKEITLKLSTVEEFISNLLVSLYDYTNGGIPEIKKMVDEFYQNPTDQTWETLTLLLEGIAWIYQTVKSIDDTNHNIAGWEEILKSIATFDVELPNLLEALENKDSTLIADIILYEILPQFEIINAETERNFEVK